MESSPESISGIKSIPQSLSKIPSESASASASASSSSHEICSSNRGLVALITGAGSGIGRATALRLAKGGWGGPYGNGTADISIHSNANVVVDDGSSSSSGAVATTVPALNKDDTTTLETTTITTTTPTTTTTTPTTTKAMKVKPPSPKTALQRQRVILILAGRRSEPLEETAKLCHEGNEREQILEEDPSVNTSSFRSKFQKISTFCIITDVSIPKDVDQLYDTIQKTYGRLDLLFNNAGISRPPVSIIDSNVDDDWINVINVNLTGCYLCARGAMRLMSTQQDPKGGRIINNGSISSVTPRPNAIAYNCSKHGVLGLTKSLALDGRSMGISCGQIDLGNVTSEMTAGLVRAEGMPQADGTKKTESTMRVTDAAKAVHAMASLPPGANVLSMTVMATDMPFVGRG